MTWFSAQGRQAIHKEIMDWLYAPFKKQQDSAYHDIANKHSKLSPKGNSNFKYAGTTYAYGYSVFGFARNLHRSLVPEMEELYDRAEKINWEEKPIISNFIINGLNLCKVPGDLLDILPEEVHPVIKKMIAADVLEEEGESPKAKVMAFKQANVDASDLIKQRLLSNLLIK